MKSHYALVLPIAGMAIIGYSVVDTDLAFLLPVTILGVIAAIFGFWLKWSIARDARKEREQSTTNH